MPEWSNPPCSVRRINRTCEDEGPSSSRVCRLPGIIECRYKYGLQAQKAYRGIADRGGRGTHGRQIAASSNLLQNVERGRTLTNNSEHEKLHGSNEFSEPLGSRTSSGPERLRASTRTLSTGSCVRLCWRRANGGGRGSRKRGEENRSPHHFDEGGGHPGSCTLFTMLSNRGKEFTSTVAVGRVMEGVSIPSRAWVGLLRDGKIGPSRRVRNGTRLQPTTF